MAEQGNDFAKKISQGYEKNTGSNWFDAVKRRLGMGGGEKSTAAPAPSGSSRPDDDSKDK